MSDQPNMEQLNDTEEQVLRTLSVEAETANNIFGKRKVFNDPIHGQIELHPVCCCIIDTPQFQRLRHIKQLDTCYLVYPGASHNRFEHSLGVCYLAGKLLKTIRDRQPDLKISQKDILCVEIAGLCHDLGQGPFSHVFEKRFMPKMIKNEDKKFTHEHIARKMFESMMYTETRAETELQKEIKKKLVDCGISDFDDNDFTFIFEMIDDPKNPENPVWPYKGRTEEKSYMYEIVANKRNGIDVDKWDYLARDSYMLGMKVNVDYNRCFSSARVIKCNGFQDRNNTNIPLRNQICYREKEAQDLYDMFYTRMTLHRRAYQHKTHKVIGVMICEALELANEHIFIKGKRISETVDDMEAYTYLTDDVIQLINNDTNKNLVEAQKILNDIKYRRLYKCVRQELCDDVTVTEKEVMDGIKSKLIKPKNRDCKPVQVRFIHCDIVKFNYGMDKNNPMEKVRFYNKNELDTAIKIDKKQVSFILPDTFEESIIRIYCKSGSQSEKDTADNIAKAFDDWWKERSEQQRSPSDQTNRKQIIESDHSELDREAPERATSVGHRKEPQVLPEHAPLEIEQAPSEPTTYSGENIQQRVPEEDSSKQ